MTLGERIKKARLAKNLNQAQLAKLVGITQQSLQAIENDSTKQPRRIKKIAEVLELSPEWLQFGVGTPPAYLNMTIAPEGKVPLIDWNLVKSWHKSYNIESIFNAGAFRVGISAVGDPLSKLHFISVPDKKNNKQFALKVKDDSMISPLPGKRSFLENNLIIVDPEIEAKEGDFIIALQGNDVVFGQYVNYGGNLYLKPLNPQYPMIAFAPNMEICGVVIAHLDVLV